MTNSFMYAKIQLQRVLSERFYRSQIKIWATTLSKIKGGEFKMKNHSLCMIIAFLFIATMLVATSTYAAPKRAKQYVAKQIVNFKVDGNLKEWKKVEAVAFDELKDVGNAIPKPDDFTGSGKVAWSASEPNRIYFAVEIIDDELQDIHPNNDKWWEDDSVEFMFDFDNGMVRDTLVQWTIAANGKEISAAGTKENCEWVVLNEGNKYIYEVAIDPTKDNPDNPGKGTDFKAEDGLLIGLSFHANDCENGAREHQIGWIPGGAWDALSYGDLIFSEEILAVDGTEKLAVTWGTLKSR